MFIYMAMVPKFDLLFSGSFKSLGKLKSYGFLESP